jgi:hypothetical protein
MGSTQETRKELKHLRINTFDNKEIEWMEITLFVIKGKKKETWDFLPNFHTCYHLEIMLLFPFVYKDVTNFTHLL